MATRSRRVLLTGADGFTGRHLVPALHAAGWDVCGMSQPGAGSGADGAADLLDQVSLDRLVRSLQPDAVIHLAAISFVGHSDPLDFYRVNMFGTMNLLAALRDAGIAPQKVIIASSANIYGSPGVELIDESMCPAPVNHYAMSKLAMEHMVRSHFEQFNVLLVRPFNYTGAGQSINFLVPKIVDHFRRGASHIELGNLDVARDFLDVRDVASAYVRLLEADSATGVVNICSGEAVSLGNILTMAEKITGHRMDVRVNPKFVRNNEIKRLAGDNAKLTSHGWRRTYTFEETLGWMLAAG